MMTKSLKVDRVPYAVGKQSCSQRMLPIPLINLEWKNMDVKLMMMMMTYIQPT